MNIKQRMLFGIVAAAAIQLSMASTIHAQSPQYVDALFTGSYTSCKDDASPEEYTFSLYDQGDETTYELFFFGYQTSMKYSYIVMDAEGVNLEVDGCSTSGTGPAGCNGELTLTRPAVPNVTQVYYFASSSPTGYPDKPTVGYNPPPSGSPAGTQGSYYAYYPYSPTYCSVTLVGQDYFRIDSSR
jgi:hypothetical protein